MSDWLINLDNIEFDNEENWLYVVEGDDINVYRWLREENHDVCIDSEDYNYRTRQDVNKLLPSRSPIATIEDFYSSSTEYSKTPKTFSTESVSTFCTAKSLEKSGFSKFISRIPRPIRTLRNL